MPKGNIVEVRISKGPRPREVPNLYGQTPAAAESRYRNLPLYPKVVGRDYSEEKRGVIISQSPKAGGTMTKDNLVEVWVSAGPQMQNVPDLIGLLPGKAPSAYPDSDFTVEVTGKEPSKAQLGTIIDQQPAAGNTMMLGSRIVVVVSGGMPRQQVPDLIGLYPDKAPGAYPDLDFSVEVTGKEPSKAQLGTIIDQQPAAGGTLVPGSRIVVVVSSGELLVPNLIGLTPAEAKGRFRKLNLSLQIKGQQKSDHTEDTIARQFPEPGNPLAVNRRIDVWLSEPKVHMMPDLIGLTQVEAESLINYLQLTIEVAGTRQDASIPLEAISQQIPLPGAKLPVNRLIKVWLSDETPQNGFWIYIAVSGGALLMFGSLALLLRVIRKKLLEPPETEIRSAPRTPSIHADAFYDAGEQRVDTERDVIKGPAVSLRLYPDRGRQNLEQLKIIKEE
jgi:beta-lactam-binding protein with PASTA domain